METIIILIIAIAFCYWLFIIRPGRLDFWKIASKYPDLAYDFFNSNQCWKVFENGLPDDHQNLVPKEQWTGPFRIWVPKLDNRQILVFGRHPDFEDSQDEFLKIIREVDTQH